MKLYDRGRNRILRTYVRNVYRYHRNEIFAAVRNEYTDWEKPIQHPINIRDATLESLSDAAGAAPALRVVQLHARRGARTYFAHFAHQNKDADYPQVDTWCLLLCRVDDTRQLSAVILDLILHLMK